MKIFLPLAISLAMWPSMAAACQFYTPTAEHLIEESENLVIAHPVVISNLPKAADDPGYGGKFRQTILWEVAVSWKGSLKPGDRFKTRQHLDRSGMCSPNAGIYSGESLLLSFRGSEPYRDFGKYSVDLHSELFIGIQDLLVRKESN